MRFAWIGCLLGLLLCPRLAPAQHASPSQDLLISGARAATWKAGEVSVIQVEGPATINTGKTILSAQKAVIWIAPGRAADEMRVEVALVGGARIQQLNGIERVGERLFADAVIRGTVRVTADERLAEDLSNSDLYRMASAMRPAGAKAPGDLHDTTQWLLRQPTTQAGPQSQPATAPATQQFRPFEPVSFTADRVRTPIGPDGSVTVVLSGNVTVLQRKGNGDLLEMQADSAVLFTPLKNLRELDSGGRFRSIEEAVRGVYLEGDVRITQTPAAGGKPDQRLLAERVYYDTTTDRAVLTDAVLHTYDFATKLPIVMRAQTVRQLSRGEYEAEGVRLTSSLFATPSYSIGASSIYARQVATGDEMLGTRTTFEASSATLRLGPVPVFWLPYAAGVVNQRGPLRDVRFGHSGRLGFYAETEWGLYESLGRLPPRDLDLTYRANYYSDRGPATGLDGQYVGGFVTESTREPWTYRGELTSFFVYDHGTDDMGRDRLTVDPPTETRGRIWWEHQQFLPGDWQVQLMAGYSSDPTFLEHWFEDEFDQSRPRETSLYIKRQRGSEALTFLTSFQFNNFPTASEVVHEQAEIERIPELGYHRIGDSVANDAMTFFSDNTVSAMRFQTSHADLADQGYALRGGMRQSPGLPSYGMTGTPSSVNYRGDLRQEIGLPLSVGQYRVMPYAMARYTGYTDSPEDSSTGRVYGGAGLRAATSLWRIDDSVTSRILDLHRLRHVVEPEFQAFYGAQSRDREDLLIYDESIDAIDEVGMVQLALHQRWQTKRGGAGRWRNVDVLSVNVEGNWFFRRPDRDQRNPADFRGLFFPSQPEASIPRTGINADAMWLVSDVVSIDGDAGWNADDSKLATASIGLAARHDPRAAYKLTFRYVGVSVDEVVDGNRFIFDEQELLTFSATYELTRRYMLAISESYDFAGNGNVKSAITVTRRFDRFFVGVTARVDRIGEDSFIGVSLYPEGFGAAAGTSTVAGLLK